MSSFFSKRVVVIILTLAIVGAVVFVVSNKKDAEPGLSPATEENNIDPKQTVIGTSVEGRAIDAYSFGSGDRHIVFVGGIHGGYEWNSVVLAYEFIGYFQVNPMVVPENTRVTVIPSANPDGVYKVVSKVGRITLADIPVVTKEVSVSGRFNARSVDLNRNFDCKWKPTSTWQSKTVSAGTKAFSEPEAKALQNFVLESSPDAVIFWHSQANAVYASECEEGILPETLDIMNAYSVASGYPAVESFTAYSITGDVEGWLASINIPAITVELKTHETIEWEKNLAGVKAIFKYYSQK
jgi:hypothetical protein